MEAQLTAALVTSAAALLSVVVAQAWTAYAQSRLARRKEVRRLVGPLVRAHTDAALAMTDAVLALRMSGRRPWRHRPFVKALGARADFLARLEEHVNAFRATAPEALVSASEDVHRSADQAISLFDDAIDGRVPTEEQWDAAIVAWARGRRSFADACRVQQARRLPTWASRTRSLPAVSSAQDPRKDE